MQESEDAIAQTGGERLILGTGCVLPIIAPYGNIVAARESSLRTIPASLEDCLFTPQDNRRESPRAPAERRSRRYHPPDHRPGERGPFQHPGGDIVDASLLDLFAGTGSVGIEALSRGAGFVRFIDINRQAVETVRANLDSTG